MMGAYGCNYEGECWGGPYDGTTRVSPDPVMSVMVCRMIVQNGCPTALAPAENIGQYLYFVVKGIGRWYWRSAATAKEPDAAGA